uniref:Uncharacterized protein n=2 Tax=Oryza TaxID=4527 RepID=A0A1Y8Z8F4_ORYRU
MNPQARS